MLRISSKLVFGRLNIGSMVVMMISDECGMLVMFLLEIIRISSMVICVFRLSLMLQVWLMKSVVKVQQSIELLRLKEQLSGSMKLVMWFLMLNFLSCFISFGQVDLLLVVEKLSSIGLCISLSRWKIFLFSMKQLVVISISQRIVRVMQKFVSSFLKMISMFRFWVVMILVMVLKMLIGVKCIMQLVILSMM